MVKKLMVKVDDNQTEFFDGECFAEVLDQYSPILHIHPKDGNGELVATFTTWAYWRYTNKTE